MIFLKMSIMKRFFSSVFWGAFVFSALWSQTVCANGMIIYVDADANGLNNGTSWTDAYTDLEWAIIRSVGVNELWVASGTYKPTLPDAFNMKVGVAIYGGFAGNETSREQRDWINNETILMPYSGGSGESISSTNRVIVGANNSTLDGFTITGGNYTEGGGMYNYQNSPIVTNCKFTGNTAGVYGGGMYNYQNNPKINNCTFVGNSADYGGGIYNFNSNATITGCIFTGNFAGNGGGIYNEQSNPIVTKCTFIDNISSEGGGIFNYYESNPIVYDCTFERNTADAAGGGIGNLGSSPIIINCKFIENYKGGGGMMNRMSSNPILVNCLFTGTLNENSDAMFNWSNSSPTIINCTFFNNSIEFGVSITNIDNSNPELINCILWGKSLPIGTSIADHNSLTQVTYSNIQGGWPGEGNIDRDPLFMDSDNGDLRLSAGSPCIDTGDNNSVPQDSLDLDGDGNITEKIPFDFADRQRIRDGNCDGQAVVDMGAYEFYLIGDLKIDCKVNFPDVAIFANNWLQTNCSSVNNWCSGSDTNRDGKTNFADLSAITKHWLEESL